MFTCDAGADEVGHECDDVYSELELDELLNVDVD